MSGRSRMPPHGMKGPPPPLHDVPPPPFGGRGRGPIHHASLLEEMRDGPPFGLRGNHAPHPAVIEERLAAQHQEIQGLLADNQRLAATHVALKQELDAAQHEIRRMSHAVANMQADKDLQLREARPMGELIQIRGDIQKLNAVRQELTENYEQGQVMEKNLISMAREVEKLRAEVANAEKRARAAAAAGNQGAVYSGNYGNPDPNYGANPYPSGYGVNPV
ncbi:hypothetical protein GW17_00031859 [Ensete ventricosum]|nr:hypothetical protein GW17_00031859 [Ensete ventricosum]RZS21331.1 hypothetical protein BHM03_00053962 [Ensete ventricosum]